MGICRALQGQGCVQVERDRARTERIEQLTGAPRHFVAGLQTIMTVNASISIAAFRSMCR